ncbi:MAG: hypothetical protein B7X04_03915 [Parcubacteria group bacterium 21-54-25]|nr:MAG: hypothetical protein B7X04_03915 [Parcubacteria group bacterium 21-54-25]HQU08141.1 Hsp20/alpha crystallin family protein [Candidatus Paceibacterota bacterium]
MFTNKKRSLLERLSGSVATDDRDNAFEDDLPAIHASEAGQSTRAAAEAQMIEDDVDAGQLPIDVFQTPDEIIIHAFVAGVRPDELGVSISRDIVVIEGTRSERQQVMDSDYFTRELFWGAFTRTILLPQEVDVDSATAQSKDGLLVVTLPKLDRTRQTKLRVKAG